MSDSCAKSLSQLEDTLVSKSKAPSFQEVVNQQRRQILQYSSLVGAMSFLGFGLSKTVMAQTSTRISGLPFEAVLINRDDKVTLANGYRQQVFLPWGTPILAPYPVFKSSAENSAEEQAQQMGMNHDGMHFFPMDIQKNPFSQTSDHGLLVMNHEYIEQQTLHPHGASNPEGKRPIDQVQKEINAHGVSVVEIKKEKSEWVSMQTPLNRRITGDTLCDMAGPAKGHALLKTAFSPDGTQARGTLNNCANGFTPWGTYLTCEENWAEYFIHQGDNPPREIKRYGIKNKSRYGWETAGGVYARFNATPTGDKDTDDFRHEPNTFGWVVEMDPFDPKSTPIKHSALGRYAHEGLVMAPSKEGQPLVCYSGDDGSFEYIYKFVSAGTFQSGKTRSELLDDGVLYVAQFLANGQGKWLALDIRDVAFQKACLDKKVNFQDQGDVLINTRTAADVVGATPMDRPEWGAISPKDGRVYFALTNNNKRTEDKTDQANPRGPNVYGQIIRWKEDQDDHAGTDFQWELYLLAGPGDNSRDPQGKALTAENQLACPDGLWFDPQGNLWIQTDMSDSEKLLSEGPFGNNQMLIASPDGEIKRFLVGPKLAEVTGITTTPDFTSVFINIQHPGEGGNKSPQSSEDVSTWASHWPDGNSARPRSATVILQRDDGKALL